MRIKFIQVYSPKQLKIIENIKKINKKNNLNYFEKKKLIEFERLYEEALLNILTIGKTINYHRLPLCNLELDLFDYYFNNLGECKRKIINKIEDDSGIKNIIIWSIKNINWYKNKEIYQICEKFSYKNIKFSLDYDTNIVSIIWKNKIEPF